MAQSGGRLRGLAAASCAYAWLGPCQRRPLSWPPGLGAAKDGERRRGGGGGVAALTGSDGIVVGGVAGSVPHAKDSSSPRETEVLQGWGWRGTAARRSGLRREMEAEAWRIGTVGMLHGVV